MHPSDYGNSKEEAMQITTDLLTSALHPAPTQEDSTTLPPLVTSVPDEPTTNSLVRANELPSIGGADASIIIQAAPPSNLTTGIVFVSKL